MEPLTTNYNKYLKFELYGKSINMNFRSVSLSLCMLNIHNVLIFFQKTVETVREAIPRKKDRHACSTLHSLPSLGLKYTRVKKTGQITKEGKRRNFRGILTQNFINIFISFLLTKLMEIE